MPCQRCFIWRQLSLKRLSVIHLLLNKCLTLTIYHSLWNKTPPKEYNYKQCLHPKNIGESQFNIKTLFLLPKWVRLLQWKYCGRVETRSLECVSQSSRNLLKIHFRRSHTHRFCFQRLHGGVCGSVFLTSSHSN